MKKGITLTLVFLNFICFCSALHAQNDITDFRNSDEFASFTSSNSRLVSKIDFNGAQVRNDYNELLASNLKTIHFPVIESNGDTSGIVIGIPVNGPGYLVFYQNNQNVLRNSNGTFSGEVGFDLFNSNTSYSVRVDQTSTTISGTLVAGPSWITNNTCSTCKPVVPSWDCIDQTQENFMKNCRGWCRFLCNVSDYAGFGSCTFGTYAGAAVWCANHNNNPK